jgi:dihydrofolate synthase/folylpolyglutamate synthase
MAFKYFADREVDYAVIETGLGGRLDATNVQMPEAVIITSISLEHTNILGDTIKKIAGEKAAIIKDKVNVFTGSLPEEAMKVIESKCAETNSRLYKIKDYMNIRNGEPELYTEELEIDDWSIPLKGNYQKFNAVLAALVVSKTLMLDNFHTINKGILNVVKNTRIQGRYEYYRRSPDIIFDSAHNPEGVENFLSEFAKDETLYGRKVLLFGAMKDKAIKEMLTLLKEYFDEIHVTSVEYERACGIEDLIKIAAEINIQVIHEKEPVDFINKFEDREKDDCLVVLGSIYLVGALKSLIKHDNIA